MKFSYKTRRFFRRLGIFALALAILFVLVWMVWMLWLDRYVVYTRDGAILDFTADPQVPTSSASPQS